MAKSKIKILIRVIGIYNEYVIQFLKDYKIGKLYIIHKVTKERDHKGTKKIYDFKKISEKFLEKLDADWGEVKVFTEILENSQDFWEIQKIIRKIVKKEKESSNGMLIPLQDVAIDFTGGTGVGTAGQLFSAFQLGITPYYVQPESVKKTDRVDKIAIPYRRGRIMGKPNSPANKILINIANSVFTVREKRGRNFFETPKDCDPKPVLGMRTLDELNKYMKEEGLQRTGAAIGSLVKANLIEVGLGYHVYNNIADDDDEPEWILHPLPLLKYYKITESGEDEVRSLELGTI